MQSIERQPPPFDTLHVSETVLPVFKTLLQQYADQHSRTKKDKASQPSFGVDLYFFGRTIHPSSSSSGIFWQRHVAPSFIFARCCSRRSL